MRVWFYRIQNPPVLLAITKEDAKYYLREVPPERMINRKYSAALWLQARGKEEASEAENRRGFIHSSLRGKVAARMEAQVD